MLKNINLIKGISFLLLASFLSFNVIADEAVAQETEVNSLAIEEIIVTARKKEESIQDVPMAVTAITEQLRESSVRRIEDIQAFAPNLFINRTPGIASGAAITIRGVASLESDKSYEPSIGVVMDGMFQVHLVVFFLIILILRELRFFVVHKELYLVKIQPVVS